MKTLKQLIAAWTRLDLRYRVGYDSDEALSRPIAWSGVGFYSLDDNGVYRYGQFPTSSRILIERAH